LGTRGRHFAPLVRPLLCHPCRRCQNAFMPSEPESFQSLVQQADRGDPGATDRLFATLYTELRRLARREAARMGTGAPLSATTLLHEAYLALSRREGLVFPDQARFLAYAARAMRGIVIDRVRERQAYKRGGGLEITSLDTDLAEQCPQPDMLASIGDALDELATLDAELAHVVDLKFFCGFTLGEIASLKGSSERTVQRQWEKARGLLFQALKTAP
jgi:RNA polymerase sigma factor (TIGR02999 family)